MNDAPGFPAGEPSRAPIARWWFDRFQIFAEGSDRLQFRDWLTGHRRVLSRGQFAGLEGEELSRAWLRNGFVPGAIGAALDEVADWPRNPDDALFWQSPARTEAAAWELHAGLAEPGHRDDELQVYLGLPWATWIDKARKGAWTSTGERTAAQQCRWTGTRLTGLRAVSANLGLSLKVHTVCQHINWCDMVPCWRALGVTDVWLSHCPPSAPAELAGLVLHPWRLYAANAEDPTRRDGLMPNRDPAERPLLASFVGAHADHYLSDVRLRLVDLATEPDMVVRVGREWHFEDTVYRQQIRGLPAPLAPAGASVGDYNRTLSDSVFALCPPGAGANTIRLWEALATGAIPVLFEPWPVLPVEGETDLRWEDALIRCRDGELPHLARRLRQISLDERRSRQRAGMRLFAQLQQQRCF